MKRRTFLAAGSAALASRAIAAPRNGKRRVGIIGHTGRGNYGHGLDTVWLQIPEAQIVAVADAHEAGRAGALKRLKCEKRRKAYQELFEDLSKRSRISVVI